jgi:hypothetical protein
VNPHHDPAATERRVAENARKERWRVIERHLHSLGITLIVALLIFVLGNQMNDAAKIARIDERNTAISVEVGTLYKKADADRDKADMRIEIVRLGTRIEQVERRVDGIERRYPPDSREP